MLCLHSFVLFYSIVDELVADYTNYKWQSIVTPIKVDNFDSLLEESSFDRQKRGFLIQGFRHGFDIGYHGPMNRRHKSSNIPLRVGTKTELWNKIMKEVQLSRFAGPYREEDLPFKEFIQSPVRLVLKSGNKTRLIFHLSYNFGEQIGEQSINFHTPQRLCTVKYEDLDTAVWKCLEILSLFDKTVPLYFSKTNFSSTFRILPVLVQQRQLLCLMAHHPVTHEKKYFIDLCLPFGSSRICALFQAFSDAVKHIAQFKLAKIWILIPF